VTVNAGTAFVQGTASATAGMYTCCLDTTATLTVATSDPTNPRIDNVICWITDNGSNTSTTVVALQTGTPAPSPGAPPLPANALLLATIAVAANAASITAGNITDARVYTVSAGGTLPMANTSGGITGPAGMYAHDLSSGRLKVSDGAGNARQPKIAATAAVYNNTVGSAVAAVGSYTTIVQVTVACDGVTEFEVFVRWGSVQPGSGTVAGDYIDFGLTLDGFVNGFITNTTNPSRIRVDSASLTSCGMGNIRDWNTPSAGTHTFALIAQSTGHAFTVNNPVIRVAPSLQQ
jgi:hypothetical protein